MRGDTNGETDLFVYDRRKDRTTRVSLGAGDAEANGPSGEAGISADRRFVAFTSAASNLVSDDANGVEDVFVRDRATGITTRVSVATGGVEVNGSSEGGAISADGRFVAFDSFASNLVPGDTNDPPGSFEGSDIFVHDRVTRTTMRVSVGAGRTQANGRSFNPAISGDGRFVAFQSAASNLVPGDTNSETDVFVHDRTSGTTSRVTVGPRNVQGNGFSGFASVSGNGRFVGFHSDATNLVPGDTNRASDIFVYDRVTKRTERVNVRANGSQSAGDASNYHAFFSADGGIVGFTSEAGNRVRHDTNREPDIFVRVR